MQIGNRFTTPLRIELARYLTELSPGRLDMCLFGSTGSEANEIALRLAKRVTGRFEIVAVERGYHGRTLGSLGLSSSTRRMRRGCGPMAPGVTLIPTPYPYRCRFGCGGSCNLACFEQAVDTIDRTTSGEPAAIVVEFVLGAGGIIPVPDNWARALRDLCKERGALLIADKALTGIGRTGRWFAFEHTGVSPICSSCPRRWVVAFPSRRCSPRRALPGRRSRADFCRPLRTRATRSSARLRLRTSR
jgi:4-aminobutyrate aminotransferase-like enzyme